MLINGHRPEELRVAIVADGVLESFQIDIAEAGLLRGNIYRGVIASVQPSLNAAFVEFGEARQGFLAGHDVVAQAYCRPPTGNGRPRVDQVLEKGRAVLVQVTKDAMGTKGAALTTNLSLAGRYLVLTPYDPMRGLSRKVEDEHERKTLKEKAESLSLPRSAGYIIRTNAAMQPKSALSRDLNALLRLWKKIQAEARRGRGPKLLYSDQDLVIQALRDYLDLSIEEVIVDDARLLERAEVFIKAFMPRSKVQLTLYGERIPLFSRFRLEEQIDAISQRAVRLPSGGSIVIDPTEALTAIDVNSGRATGESSHEETALATNMEAAAEVGRQLRLRDIGGLIVVDFIDMRSRKHQRAVEKAVKDSLKTDKARSSVTRLSPNGLLEINRQRIKQPLALRTHRACPTCKGTGMLASPEHVGLSLLRRIEARAAAGKIGAVKVRLHPELADAIQNHRRRDLASLEEELEIHVDIIAAPGLHRSDEEIQWIGRDGSWRDRHQAAQRDAHRARGARTASVSELGAPQESSPSPPNPGVAAEPTTVMGTPPKVRKESSAEKSSSRSAKRRARKRRQVARQRRERGCNDGSTNVIEGAETKGAETLDPGQRGQASGEAPAPADSSEPKIGSKAPANTTARSARRRRRRPTSRRGGRDRSADRAPDE